MKTSIEQTLGRGMIVAAMTLGVVAVATTQATLQSKAAEVYADKCVVCHGADGAGKTVKGRKLKVKDVHETAAKMTAAQMLDVVMKGKDPDMDAFGKELGPDLSKQIVDYYRSLAAKK